MFKISIKFFAFILPILLFSAFFAGKNPSNVSLAEYNFAKPDTTRPAPKLPPGADPEDPDWKGIDLEPKAPQIALSPAEQQKLFLLPEGYQIEPVLTEPQIQQPAAISFDGNGRMYVLELRTYMLDADSKGELEPTSRISRWEDKNNDGVYETGTAFVDNLIFPRFVLPYDKDAILTMESDADNVYKYTDTNGDGVADKKEFFTNKYGRSGNVEHQQAFMYYGMDNWLYSTVNAFRVRETPAGVIREKTGFNRAQWGITHDDDGKLWFQGGASGHPSYFQFPIQYGNFEVPNEFAKGFDVPWGAAVKIADMQGGMDEIRMPDGSLKRVTGSAGNDVFRGDRLPKSLQGQYFYGEPVARIVRQINPVVSEGLTTLHNVYQDQQSEFLRSTDPLFRPVDMTTAPDGTLYITDMYRGIIQEGEWTKRGTYLRTKIEQYQLDKIVGLGRIWRITYKGMERNKTKPNMFNEKSAALVKHLEHPNGWWRDEAQKLLVLRKDLSVVPLLNQIVNTSKNQLARTHAIWTLEGLGALKTPMVKKLLTDANPKIKIQALRASETLYKAGDKSLETDYQKLLLDANTDVKIQAMLTAKFLQLPDLQSNIKLAMASSEAKGVKLVGEQIINPPRPRGFGVGGVELSQEQKESIERGSTIYNELCSQCHGNNGMGTPVGNKLMAPALAGSMRIQGHPEYAVKVILHGMEGNIEGKTYTANVMAPMRDQNDQWIADVVSYIRSGLSNDASIISASQVAQIREKTKGTEAMYKFADLVKEIPVEIIAKDIKATASHSFSTRVGGNVTPAAAFTYEGWSTGGRQSKDMWFLMEFPKVINLAEVQFVATSAIKPGWRRSPAPANNGGTPPAFTPPPMIQNYPRSFVVEVSEDGQNWKEELTNAKGNTGENKLVFNQTKAKFLRIKLTEDLSSDGDSIPWAMRSMKVYARN